MRPPPPRLLPAALPPSLHSHPMSPWPRHELRSPVTPAPPSRPSSRPPPPAAVEDRRRGNAKGGPARREGGRAGWAGRPAGQGEGRGRGGGPRGGHRPPPGAGGGGGELPESRGEGDGAGAGPGPGGVGHEGAVGASRLEVPWGRQGAAMARGERPGHPGVTLVLFAGSCVPPVAAHRLEGSRSGFYLRKCHPG